MTPEALSVVQEIQAILNKHCAALFFGPDHEAEVWIEGKCAGHITHNDNCELSEGSVCEVSL